MNSPLPPINLRCEYEFNPLGIDDRQPRLSWQVNDSRRGAKQSAYEIWVTSGLPALKSTPDLWNSGKIASDQSIHVAYKGKTLISRQHRLLEGSHVGRARPGVVLE